MATNPPMSYSAAVSGRKDQPQKPQAQAAGQQQQQHSPAQPSQNQHSGPTPSHNSNRPRSPPRQQQHQSHPQPQHQTSSPSGNTTGGAYTRETYVRRSEQTPHTSAGANERTYIISLKTSSALHHTLTSLRNAHFPKHLNKLEAHVALFRALPGSQLARIEKDVQALCQKQKTWKLQTEAEGFRMRQGVGIRLKTGKSEAQGVWRNLENGWKGEGWLSEQDSGGFSPHWTVMNKVEEERVVQGALEDVGRVLKKEGEGGGGLVGRAEGLTLWEYRKGYWNFRKEWRFEGGEA